MTKELDIFEAVAKRLGKGYPEYNSDQSRDQGGRWSAGGAALAAGALGAVGLLAAARGNPRMAMNMVRRQVRRAGTRASIPLATAMNQAAQRVAHPLGANTLGVVTPTRGAGLRDAIRQAQAQIGTTAREIGRGGLGESARRRAVATGDIRVRALARRLRERETSLIGNTPRRLRGRMAEQMSDRGFRLADGIL